MQKLLQEINLQEKVPMPLSLFVAVTLESLKESMVRKGYVYQELVDLQSYHGRYPILGSWVIGGEPSGMGIRENESRITDNMSYFVPHVII